MGFTGQDKKPTNLWKGYRNKEKGPALLSHAIKSAYNLLYETYPDAHQRDDEALRNLLSSHTDVGEGALSYMVGTFRTLVSIADFEGVELIEINNNNNDNDSGNKDPNFVKDKLRNVSKELVININIQLQLPESSDSETFDKFFEALHKHLLKE